VKAMEKDEELLIRKAQRGNLQAFESLIQKYDTRVMKIAYDMVNNVDDARDIYQEVFIKVYRSIDKFRFASEFYTWLFRIAVNTCISFRRQRLKRQDLPFDEFESEHENHWKVLNKADAQNPEEQLLNQELNHLIQKSIAELSAQQRAVFVLRHYHGHKLKEIAEIMNCTEGTVKNYLFRATQKLQRSIQQYQKS